MTTTTPSLAKHATAYLTTYKRGNGHRFTAVQVPWAEVTALLGRDHDGSPHDDRAVMDALVKAGARFSADWSEGWVDEAGWGLIGPEKGAHYLVAGRGKAGPWSGDSSAAEWTDWADAAPLLDSLREAGLLARRGGGHELLDDAWLVVISAKTPLDCDLDYDDAVLAHTLVEGTDDDTHAKTCECGAATGQRCAAELDADHVMVEFMPECLRASHEAAGNRGTYPANGALRLCVDVTCAEQLLASDPEWTEVIRGEELVDDPRGKDHVGNWAVESTYVSTYDNGNEPGACDVQVLIGEACGRWYLRTQDNANGSDDADDNAYASRAEAEEAAKTFASEHHEAAEGEDAEAYLARLKATLVVSYRDQDGSSQEASAESLEGLAAELASQGYDGPSLTVHDAAGFTRGWVSAGQWRAS